MHYAQTFATGEFREFDYRETRGGKGLNEYHYGQNEPPLIDLNSTGNDVPVAIFWGKQDTLTEKVDIEWLIDELGESVIYS